MDINIANINRNVDINTSRNLFILFFITIILFVFSPLLTLVFIFVFVTIGYANVKLYTKENTNLINLCCILCAIFISCINITKVPYNDLLWYVESYRNASSMNFFDYIDEGADITGISKEPAYGAMVWCMNRIFSGNIVLFKFSITLINYLLLNFSIAKFCKHFHFSIDKIITAVFLMCFIPYIFTMSLQLLRQFLAGSLLVYILIDICFFHKRNWLLIVCMVLMHSTSFIFIPFLVLPFLDKPFMKNKIYYFALMALLIAIQTIAEFLLNLGLLNEVNSLNYALQRASQEVFFDMPPFPLWKIIVIVIIAGFHFYLGYIRINHIRLKEGLKRYCNTILFLSVFILLNIHQAELSNRLLFYLFPFLPFMIVWGVRQLKLSIGFLVPFVLVMIVFWIKYLDIGTWIYELPANIWITPIFLYFM